MYLKELDGLRGLAALNVVVAHFLCAFLPFLMSNNYPTIFASLDTPSQLTLVLSSPFTTVFFNGHFAVMVFFVLSGCVLTLPYFSNSCITLRRRVWGRYVRLGLPVAASITIAYILLKTGVYYNKPAASISGSTGWLSNFYNDVSFNDFLSLVFYKGIIFGDGALNPPLWTLKVEFLGSLLLLAFYMVKPRGNELRDVVLLGGFLFFILGTESIYYLCLFGGALLNTLERLKFKWLVLFLGLYFGAYQYESFLYKWLPTTFSLDSKTLYNAIGALMLVASVKHGCFKNFLTGKLCQFLGQASFSVYLIHLLVLCSLISYLYVMHVSSTIGLMVLFLFYIIMSYVFATLFHLAIDKQSTKLSRHLSSKII
ncbi:acyltransferase family protein [Vibrio sp. 10N.261.54.A5]|uniref:acyltransferase family protein n=1 Tax=Vibrio sp. 10N.261.54.A5 TaxID=3229686 RepID=UPI00354BE937